MAKNTLNETELFSKLEDLCSSPGYAHAIAYFCFRDNTIKYVDNIEVNNVLQQFSFERLVRTEISTLIGLSSKSSLDLNVPHPKVLQAYLDDTEQILLDIHHCMIERMALSFLPKEDNNAQHTPFDNYNHLREPIFYGGESAYNFQYRDFSLQKYQNDMNWFLSNKGYSVDQAINITHAISKIQIEKLNNLAPAIEKTAPEKWTFLPAFTFTLKEISRESCEKDSTVKAFLSSFVIPSKITSASFSALDDFNPTNAYPIIKLGNNEFILFQNYSLVEALYETPFYWFMEDNKYKETAKKNRGAFTEQFSEGRLKSVFGEKRVFTNIDIYEKKNIRVGEIDVLVIFGNRAIIVQAKSKKLTIEARKGNDNCLKNDFKEAVQSSYNQAYKCASFLNNDKYKLIDAEGRELKIPRSYKEIYPFCVVSDHYPALSSQTRHFLKYQETNTIMPPYVMDIFFLDVMSEMLQSPLLFLSFINRRVKYGDRIISNHELTILSYHLKQNLWVDDEHNRVILGDDCCADLDLAMLTRRNNVLGIDTPEGILTKYKNTHFDHFLNEINARDNPNTIELGFMLLTLNENTINQLNKGVSVLIERALKDGKNHDLTLAFGAGVTGLTVHCNNDYQPIAELCLEEHCLRRKYTQKANTWFGLCINPKNSLIRFGITCDHEWVQSNTMDKKTERLLNPQYLKADKSINFNTYSKSYRRIGRNEKCPCGSDKKYKKCCLR